MSSTLLLLSAVVMNILLGGPRRLYSALGVTRVGRYPKQGVRELERRLNRNNRTVQERKVRGWVVVCFVAFVCVVFGMLLEWILQDILWVKIILLAALLPFRSTLDCVLAIRRALLAKSLFKAREALEYTVWKNYAVLDEHGVARAGVEIMAVNFSEKIVAPALFFLLFGLPGLFLSKMMYLMQETLVRPTESEMAFAEASRSIHHFLHYIPARITALLWLTVSVFMPSARIGKASEEIFNGLVGESPQDLSLLSAAAVLRLSLGGPMSAYVHEGWVGGGTAKVMPGDMGRAVRAFIWLQMLLFCFIGLFI